MEVTELNGVWSLSGITTTDSELQSMRRHLQFWLERNCFARPQHHHFKVHLNKEGEQRFVCELVVESEDGAWQGVGRAEHELDAFRRCLFEVRHFSFERSNDGERTAA